MSSWRIDILSIYNVPLYPFNFPCFEVCSASNLQEPISSSLGSGKQWTDLVKNRMLWSIWNWLLSPLSCQKGLGDFSSCDNLIEVLQVKLTKVWAPCSPSFYLLDLSTLSFQQLLKDSASTFPMKLNFYSVKLWFSVSACLFNLGNNSLLCKLTSLMNLIVDFILCSVSAYCEDEIAFKLLTCWLETRSSPALISSNASVSLVQLLFIVFE